MDLSEEVIKYLVLRENTITVFFLEKLNNRFIQSYMEIILGVPLVLFQERVFITLYSNRKNCWKVMFFGQFQFEFLFSIK